MDQRGALPGGGHDLRLHARGIGRRIGAGGELAGCEHDRHGDRPYPWIRHWSGLELARRFQIRAGQPIVSINNSFTGDAYYFRALTMLMVETWRPRRPLQDPLPQDR